MAGSFALMKHPTRGSMHVPSEKRQKYLDAGWVVEDEIKAEKPEIEVEAKDEPKAEPKAKDEPKAKPKAKDENKAKPKAKR